MRALLATVCLAVSLLTLAPAQADGHEAGAAVVAEDLVFELEDGRISNSVIYYPADLAEGEARPGVLVLPEWWGLNDYSKGRAQQLAEAGYVALALDLYGDGFSTTSVPEAAGMAGPFYENRQQWRELLTVAHQQLADNPATDSAQLAAIGFCFGGTGVLELAYTGADLAGVVSFHGNPLPALEEDHGRVAAKLLVLHGAADPFVTPEQLEDFAYAADQAEADWQLVLYARALHAFTNPAADDAGLEGVGYQEDAAVRSEAHMHLFFADVFGGE